MPRIAESTNAWGWVGRDPALYGKWRWRAMAGNGDWDETASGWEDSEYQAELACHWAIEAFSKGIRRIDGPG